MYNIEIKHEGLNKFREIKGKDPHVVKQKALMQELQWEEQWNKKQEMEAKKAAREKAAQEKEEKKNLALQLTEEAVEQLNAVENTLAFTLEVNDKINWEDLKDFSVFDVEKPSKPDMVDVSPEPNQDDSLYQPKISIIDRIFSGLKEKKISDANELFKIDHKKWVEDKKEKELKYKQELEKYEELLKEWEEKKNEFLAQQKEKNNAIDIEKELYHKKFQQLLLIIVIWYFRIQSILTVSLKSLILNLITKQKY